MTREPMPGPGQMVDPGLPGLVEQYRADVDLVDPESAEEWWRERFHYSPEHRAWLSNEGEPTLEGMAYVSVDGSPPDFEATPLTAPLGEATPACRCYRCGELLTARTVRMDLATGHPRPVCGRCSS